MHHCHGQDPSTPWSSVGGVSGSTCPTCPEPQCCVTGKSQMSASQIWTVTCCVAFHALLTLSGLMPIICRMS